jgi:hypothetical protein
MVDNTTFIDEAFANGSGNPFPANKDVNQSCESVKKQKRNGPHGFFTITDSL